MGSLKSLINFDVIPRVTMNFHDLKLEKIEIKSPINKSSININSKFLAKLDLILDLINIPKVKF